MSISKEWKLNDNSFFIVYLDNNMNPIDESKSTCYRLFVKLGNGFEHDVFGTFDNADISKIRRRPFASHDSSAIPEKYI